MPTTSWTGRFTCPECSERIEFEREQDLLPEFRDAFVVVAHIHEDDDPHWRISAYRRAKRQRVPADARELLLHVKEQRKSTKKVSS